MTEHQSDWPTPEFDRPDTLYQCSNCDTVVNPDEGDAQAAVLVAGATTKLCEDCGRELQSQIRGN